MKLQIVQPNQKKALFALQGVSGCGKSYCALLLAHALSGDWGKVAVIDTSDGAIAHYSYFGPFQTLLLAPPFSPQKFTDALLLCERAGIAVVIVDSLSSEWIGKGGVEWRIKNTKHGNEEDAPCLLDAHYRFMDILLHSNMHVIITLQVDESSKGSDVMGPAVLDPVQEAGIHYHFDTVVQLDREHNVQVVKDRTSFFEDHDGVLFTEEIAALYSQWLREDLPTSLDLSLPDQIKAYKSLRESLGMLAQDNGEETNMIPPLVQIKDSIEPTQFSNQNLLQNGTSSY